MTHDIIVNGKMPTLQQYRAALDILQCCVDNNGVYPRLPTDMDDSHHAAWVACCHYRLIAEEKPGISSDFVWSRYIVTALGRLYLKERKDDLHPRK